MNRTFTLDARTREVWNEQAGTATVYVDGVAASSRPLSVDEAATLVEAVDARVRRDIHARVRQALAANAAFLAIAAPTNAQRLAHERALTRQHNAIIRLLLALDGARDLLVESTDV